jgi:hypothetical protein
MLVEKSFEQAMPLVQILDAKEFCVAPIPNTPLAALVSASNAISTAVNSLTEDYGTVEPTLLAAGTDNETHNKLFDETIAFISKAVLQHVSNAKNIVAPVVMGIANKIIARSQEELLSVKTYAIVPVFLPAPMLNEGFKDSIDKAQGGVYADPQRFLKLKSTLSEESVLQVMLTGSNEYDEKIKEWYNTKGFGFFAKVWEGLFQDPDLNNAKESLSMIKLFEDKDDGVDAALTVYLLARNLFENIPENTGLTLVEYKRTVSEYKDAAAIRLSRAYSTFETQEKAGILVLSYEANSKEIKVNGGTYSAYIKNGGKNETILGAVVNGPSTVPYNVNVVKDNQQQYLDAWDRYTAFTAAESRNRAIVVFKDICLSVFLSDLTNLTTFEQEFVAANPGHIDKCQEIAREVIDTLTTDHIAVPYDVALSMVCKARFYYTDAEKILSTINSVSKENKEIDVREAALIATTEYLIDYITDQMKVI